MAVSGKIWCGVALGIDACDILKAYNIVILFFQRSGFQPNPRREAEAVVCSTAKTSNKGFGLKSARL